MGGHPFPLSAQLTREAWCPDGLLWRDEGSWRVDFWLCWALEVSGSVPECLLRVQFGKCDSGSLLLCLRCPWSSLHILFNPPGFECPSCVSWACSGRCSHPQASQPVRGLGYIVSVPMSLRDPWIEESELTADCWSRHLFIGLSVS